MMKVIRAEERHVKDAIAWMVKRGMPELPPDVFSSAGFVVEGVAGVWVYLTDSTMAWLEMLIGNPDASREERSRGLDAVIDAAVAFASEQGLRTLIAPVERRSPVLRRAHVHGFNTVLENVTLTALPLGGP